MEKMIEKLQNGDIIITKNYIKESILKELYNQKRLINCKFISLENLKYYLFDYPKKEALHYLMKKHFLKIDIAQEYIKNIHLDYEKIPNYREELRQNNLLEKKALPHHKRIIVIGYVEIEPIIKNKLDKLNTIYIKEKEEKYTHQVYEFNSQTEEIVHATNKICDELKNINIEKIRLVVPNDEYKSEIDRIFKLFNIKLEYNQSQSIYSCKTTKDFIKNLKKERDIQKALENIQQNEIYSQIIDLLNVHSYIKEVDDAYIEIIENELKKTKIKKSKNTNSLKVISPEEIFSKDIHYYILGLNQNIIPKIHNESGLIPDKYKKNLGLFTSIDKNQNEIKSITRILTNYPHIYISYKLQDNYQNYFPSTIISDLNLKIVKNSKIEYNHSDNFNKLELGKMLDNYINYSEEDKELKNLYITYPNSEHKTYNNEYTNINLDDLKQHLNDHLTLSYSSMNNYFLCPFKFYIENILKLNDYETTFPILIGNLFHHALEKIYDENFDLDNLFTEYLKEIELTPKEKFYINKLKNILMQDIEVIKMQDNHTLLKEKLREKKIIIEKKSKLNVSFIGIVDKISKLENYIVVTDYKTGGVTPSLDNIDDGLNLQLPTYIYLIKKGINKNYKIVGFYLQKLLHSKPLDQEENIIDNLKLNGYTINKEEIIKKIDDTYENSKIIKGMKKSSNGFYKYTKLINKENIDKISEIVDKNIDKVIRGVETTNFKINPKRLEDKLVSCEFCKYKDLCFRKEEDITNLKHKTLEEIVGDKDAKLD